MLQSALHRTIFEAVSDLIFVIEVGDDESFRCVTVNPAYLRRTGLELSQLVGKSVEDILPPDAAQFALRQYREAVRHGVTLTYEEWTELPGGEVYIETTLQPLADESGNVRHLLGVARDITERKRLELRLVENEQRYLSLFIKHPYGGFALDRGGLFTLLNEQLQMMLGYGYKELIGKPFATLLPPESEREAAAAFRTALSGSTAEFETALLHRDGTNRYAQITVTPISQEGTTVVGALGIVKDVTAQRNSEQRLAESEARYQKLLELLPNAVLVHTNKQIVFCNKECAASFGEQSPADLIGLPIEQFVEPASLPAVLDRTEALLELQSELVTRELTYLRKDGTAFEVESTAAFIVYEGRPSVQVVFRDITERKKAEQQLREANERLRQLSHVDGLTGVANRRRFDEALRECGAEASAQGKPMAIIMTDIDAFKSFNDHYGHLRGDDCLRLIALELQQQQFGPDALAARFGGEEFVLLLPNVGLWEAAAAAERLRSSIERLQLVHDYSPVSPFITVSVGVASGVPSKPADTWQLLHQADQALYEAKNTGRNRVSLKQPV
jgi:diguanylate cyclase (GGDEF)-like protein/PAS domain S-box-containing protein